MGYHVPRWGTKSPTVPHSINQREGIGMGPPDSGPDSGYSTHRNHHRQKEREIRAKRTFDELYWLECYRTL